MLGRQGCCFGLLSSILMRSKVADKGRRNTVIMQFLHRGYCTDALSPSTMMMTMTIRNHDLPLTLGGRVCVLVCLCHFVSTSLKAGIQSRAKLRRQTTLGGGAAGGGAWFGGALRGSAAPLLVTRCRKTTGPRSSQSLTSSPLLVQRRRRPRTRSDTGRCSLESPKRTR